MVAPDLWACVQKPPSLNVLKIVQNQYFKTKNHDLTSLFKKLIEKLKFKKQ